jgi:hypothetical protein
MMSSALYLETMTTAVYNNNLSLSLTVACWVLGALEKKRKDASEKERKKSGARHPGREERRKKAIDFEIAADGARG